VNGTPNLYYHYHKQGPATPVASMLLRKLLGADLGAGEGTERTNGRPVRAT
jgi:hypothetical protein